ncbi:type IV pilus assembly protein PilB [Persephonella hydrogeniphila]|uniref:Type IV pilus assembly protein PilB n=1 Tax=Persephonella hydrogeniphila TaxID=198703 RepID=A0A285N0D9_9AQUI|nr:GspE/PulE family protein [Persephonella hydrogeniphila]SNZ02900.1 type IV pilus assembly protein PilB [Persephonella hydrogeniphila]
MPHKPIGQLLKELGYITEEQIQVALEVQEVKGGLFGEILQELSFVSPREVAEAIATQSGKPFIDLSQYQPSKEALKLLDKNMAKQFRVLPFNVENGQVDIAMADPYDLNAIDIVRRRTGLDVNVYVADTETLLKTIEIQYFLLERPIDKEIKDIIEKAKAGAFGGSVPKFVELIINHAIIERATDIHISPEDLASHIFFRVDGIMQHYYAFPKEMHSPVVSRIKVLAGMDIAEQRLPQDGSFSHEFFNESYDMRVSSIPTAYGENVVIRVLSKNLSLFNLKSLGFEEKILKILEEEILKPQGIVLVTGPTGSGKTTTLYAALRKINALKRNILTVEDPIEYKFPFIKQTQVNEKAGYTFARAIRHFLRQDPDVILVGEIRDEETAEMAMRASITGHLVLSTLHTNDAVSAIPRLIDMKIRDYMVASGISAITAQRLVRKICSFCKEEKTVNATYLLDYGFEFESIKKFGNVETLDEEVKIFYGKGCGHCRGTGYLGRTVIAELLRIDHEIADLIVKGATPLSILEKAREKGMWTLKEDGLIKVFKGITTPEEVKRVTG